MHKLKRSISYILIIFSGFLFSQESSLIFNRFNLSVFNPAFTGVEGPAINLNTRAQWIGIEDAPLTNYLIVHFPEKKNATLGLTIQNDRVFVENKTLLTLDYSYRLQLSENSNISLGLKAGGMFFNVETFEKAKLDNFIYKQQLEEVEFVDETIEFIHIEPR